MDLQQPLQAEERPAPSVGALGDQLCQSAAKR